MQATISLPANPFWMAFSSGLKVAPHYMLSVFFVRPDSFISWFTGFISDLGGRKKKKKKTSENVQLTGHFQRFFFHFQIIFLISP